MASDTEAAALSRTEFWDERYSKADEGDKPTHEWFQDFAALEPFFHSNLFEVRSPESNPHLLHLGSGDSTIPYDLLRRGYKNHSCIDFSSILVELMKTRHPEPEVQWIVGDVRNMESIPSKTIDIAFDKGTLDAMIYGSPWSPPEEVMENTGRYISEVLRVLKDDGSFLYVTYRQPHFVKPILNRNNNWDVRVETLGGGDSFEYFGFILKKPPSGTKEHEGTT